MIKIGIGEKVNEQEDGIGREERKKIIYFGQRKRAWLEGRGSEKKSVSILLPPWMPELWA